MDQGFSEDTHITVVQNGQLGLLREFCTAISHENLKLEVKNHSLQTRSMATYAELATLAAVAVVLHLPYFRALQEQAAKDHYPILRKALKSLWKLLVDKNRNYRTVKVTAHGTEQPKYSLDFAIYAPLEEGCYLKFVVPDGCTHEEYSEGVNEFLTFIESHHLGKEYKKTIMNVEDLEVFGNLVLLEYDKDSQSLRVVNPRKR